MHTTKQTHAQAAAQSLEASHQSVAKQAYESSNSEADSTAAQGVARTQEQVEDTFAANANAPSPDLNEQADEAHHLP